MALAAVAADQLTKHVVASKLALDSAVDLVGPFSIHHVQNSGIAFGLFFLMLHMQPDYIALLWTDPLGIQMSIFALVMQVLGALCIKKIVDIKV